MFYVNFEECIVNFSELVTVANMSISFDFNAMQEKIMLMLLEAPFIFCFKLNMFTNLIYTLMIVSMISKLDSTRIIFQPIQKL